MTRMLCLLLIMSIESGCGLFRPKDPASTELAATVMFVQGDTALDAGSGIVSVGNYYFRSVPVKLAYIAPGVRQLGYNCPGEIYVDGPPIVEAKFEGGKRYELFCKNGAPVLRDSLP